MVFGITLTFVMEPVPPSTASGLSGEALTRLQRLDHVGIYLLIAGTYTPIAWGLMRGPVVVGNADGGLDGGDRLRHTRSGAAA